MIRLRDDGNGGVSQAFGWLLKEKHEPVLIYLWTVFWGGEDITGIINPKKNKQTNPILICYSYNVLFTIL